MPIGGAEDKARPAAVLTRFVALAGGPRASIVVISTASSLSAEITSVYLRAFDELGAGQVVGIRPETRIEADLPALAVAVEAATGVFMTGGNQMKLSTALGGTRLGAAIRAAHESGVVVAGTSAGASAIGRHMAHPGDLVVVCVDAARAVWDELQDRTSRAQAGARGGDPDEV